MVTPQPDAGPPVVPRLIEELDAHPEAREPSLRALLTDEFLHMPARLARIEGIVESSQGDMKVVQGDMKVVQGDMKVVQGDMKVVQGDMKVVQGDMKVVQGDMKVVQGDMKVVQGDVKNLQVEVGWLKGKALETDFGHRATSIMNLRFGLPALSGSAGAKQARWPITPRVSRNRLRTLTKAAGLLTRNWRAF